MTGVIDPQIISIIPTPVVGREYLDRAIRSWHRAEPGPRDLLLLVGDTFENTDIVTETVTRIADASPNATIRAITHDGGRSTWGHDQCNAGIRWVRTHYPDAFIAWMDDDDVFAPHAFTYVRADIERFGERVYLYRFLTHYRLTVWTNTELHEGHISGQCLVAPAKWSADFGERYEGDFDSIRQTVENGGGEDRIMWRESLIGVARPHAG